MLYITVSICILVILVGTWLMRRLRVGHYEDKSVFITGCDTGFGNLLAKKLDSMGFHVFAGCLTETGATELKRSCSTNLVAIQIDVTKEASIADAVKEVKKHLHEGKGLWAVVNNAGVPGISSPIEWVGKEVYENCLAVNLYGVILVTVAFLPLLRSTPGRIINMASIAGRLAITSAPYAISKFGVEAFSEVLRRQLYHTGVTVHIIEPGFFKTSMVMVDNLRRKMESRFDSLDPEIQEYYGKEYRDAVATLTDEFLKTVPSSKLYKVTDTYVHAITAKYPKSRYVVGLDANTVARFLWTVPDWLGDLILCHRRPVPKGARKIRK